MADEEYKSRPRTAEELDRYMRFQFELFEYMKSRGSVKDLDDFIARKAPLAQMVADDVIQYERDVDWDEIKREVDKIRGQIEKI